MSESDDSFCSCVDELSRVFKDGQFECVESLVQRAVDLDFLDWNNDFPLSHASQLKSKYAEKGKAVDMLLKKADLRVPPDFFKAILHDRCSLRDVT